MVVVSSGDWPASPRIPSVPKSFLISLSGVFRNNFSNAALDLSLSEARYEALLLRQTGCVLNESSRLVEHERIPSVQNGQRGESLQLAREALQVDRAIVHLTLLQTNEAAFKSRQPLTPKPQVMRCVLPPETGCEQMQLLRSAPAPDIPCSLHAEPQFIDTLLTAGETFAQNSERCIDAQPGATVAGLHQGV